MIEEPTKERIAKLDIWLSLNWIPLIAACFILFMLVPYFISPYVLIIDNPMDIALIQYIGETMVKPLLYAGFSIGSLLGLVPIRFYQKVFTDIRNEGRYKVFKVRQGVAIIAPFFGILPHFLYGIMTFLPTGIASWEWGTIVYLFVTLPAIGFMLFTSLGWIILRWKAEHVMNNKIHFTRIIGNEKAYLLTSEPIKRF